VKRISDRLDALEARQEAEDTRPAEIWLVGVDDDGNETKQRARIYPPADDQDEAGE
jgi:hypothetical protein